jgi:DNA-binding NarL/FixJ family response regulator
MSLGIGVLIVDDHAILREGLKMLLEDQPDLAVVGEAESGKEALTLADQLRPDVVVMDISMPDMNGLAATAEIRRRHPAARVVILTMHRDHETIRRVTQCGAIGCVIKTAMGTELIDAIRAAAINRSYFSSSIADLALEARTSPPMGEGRLTLREREILRLAVNGCTNKRIAESLNISIKTVQAHRGNLMRKLDAHNRTDLVRYAASRGMIRLA